MQFQYLFTSFLSDDIIINLSQLAEKQIVFLSTFISDSRKVYRRTEKSFELWQMLFPSNQWLFEYSHALKWHAVCDDIE